MSQTAHKSSALSGYFSARYNWKERIFFGVGCGFSTARYGSLSGMAVPEAYADYYDFFENGDGLHSYYDYYGRFVSDPFVWDIRRPGELYIRYLDYSIGSYFLYYDYDGAYLYLSDYPDFYYYDAYARVGW